MPTVMSVVEEIDGYIRQRGGAYPSWYVGIAADPRDRLFNDHNVNEHGDAWIHRDAGSESAAREVEKHFVALGCGGGEGGGSYQTRFVYAYKMAPHTRP